MKKKMLIGLFCLLFVLFTGCGKTEGENNNQDKNQDQNTTQTSNANIAILYFSCTSHTKHVATLMAEYYHIPTFEIEAKIPYTGADLNYGDTSSRTSIEQNDDSARPEIKHEIDISNYEYIFLGYPIWWGQAPKIMYTFVESHDLTNKIIIPFCTSASSGLGTSASNLSKNQTGTWLVGKRFSTNESKENVENWLKSLPIVIENVKA